MLGTAVHAQAPLTVDELLATRGTLKTELALTHLAQPVGGVAAGTVREQGNLLAGLRYGVARGTDVYVRTGVEGWRQSSSRDGSVDTGYGSAVAGIITGLTHEWLPERDHPALLLGGEIGWLEPALPGATERTTLASWRLRATSYRTLDPLVLSLGAVYEHGRSRKLHGLAIDPGAALTLTPLVNFAVNSRVSLSGGIGWRLQQGARIDRRRLGPDATHTDVLLGLGFSPARGNSLFLQTRFSTTRHGVSQLSLDWVRTF